MLVLSSPSGAGKTTISRALLERDGNLSMSVSATTRPKRPGEVSGRLRRESSESGIAFPLHSSQEGVVDPFVGL